MSKRNTTAKIQIFFYYAKYFWLLSDNETKKNFHRKVPVKAYKSITNPFCHYVPSHIFLFSSKPNREKQLSQHK